MTRDELLQGSQSIPLYDIIKAFKILLHTHSSNSQNDAQYDLRILRACKSIFFSEQQGQAFLYLCREGAATSWLLQVRLGLPESTSYQVLKRLRALGVVENVIKIPKSLRRRGPIPKVWGLVGNYKGEDVARCINLHYRTLSPKYRLAEEIAQKILDEYLSKRLVSEVSFREILAHVRELRTPFVAGDVADLAAQYLAEQGMKVWR